jgi:Arf/Sar family protein
VGLNVKEVKKGNLKIKVWDLGGQVQYRPEWLAYSQGCHIIIFMVDSSNTEVLPICKNELFQLLENKELNNTPILICSNKIDINPHLSE